MNRLVDNEFHTVKNKAIEKEFAQYQLKTKDGRKFKLDLYDKSYKFRFDEYTKDV